MICWGLGAFGLGLTGMLETNTKEDMGEHAQLVLLWAANLTSQPNTARHLLAAERRGARIVTIDVRRTEAAAKSDDVLLIRPGTDTALALAMMHVICADLEQDTELSRGTRSATIGSPNTCRRFRRRGRRPSRASRASASWRSRGGMPRRDRP